MTIAYHTLGCKLNYAETSAWEKQFAAAGFETVPWGKPADLYLVNTCSVTEHANQKARGVIRRAHRVAPGARIIVTGCYAQLRPAEVRALEGVALVVGAAGKASLFETVRTALRDGFPAPEPAPAGDGAPQALRVSGVMPAYSSGERTRAFLKVQDGCSNYCAYCTVPYARGESRSLRIAEVVAQAREIAAKGMKEIVLTGVNTGDFGRGTGESFLDLLKALNEVEGIERYRISSIEPNLITEEMVDWIASGTKFLPHFHIPLQTGSDELLRRMGRRYNTALFAEKMDYIRRRMEGPGLPKVFFGIDVMVGLPGETDELFAQTCAFIRRVRPAFIHVFPYSRRPGTRAATMKGQLPERIKTERVAQLKALSDSLSEAFLAENRGIAETVLFESREKGGTMSGYTRNYIRITVPYDKDRVGKTAPVIIGTDHE
ncbi:MAG: tRNA (N(6)-L-threonylcarbamoyladenosine(37)-C(2))-methylthiotransferase MtaB [Bacteroidales bacterium]|nr:tRNA (N(6)-L-threonylcarbamoyladenosine(37)-C(2))-methylthiotransferase MtaB [Bacteroidales bacterium]